MIKKIFATLTSSWDRMTDYNKRQAKIIQDRLKTDQDIAREQADRQARKYVSERTVPSGGEILGPSDAKPKEEK